MNLTMQALNISKFCLRRWRCEGQVGWGGGQKILLQKMKDLEELCQMVVIFENCVVGSIF